MARTTGTIEDTLRACENMWTVFGDDASVINMTPRDYFKSYKAMYPKELSELLVKEGYIAYDPNKSTSKDKYIYWNVKPKPHMKWLEGIMQQIRDKKAEIARNGSNVSKQEPKDTPQEPKFGSLLDRLNADLYTKGEELENISTIYKALTEEVNEIKITIKTLERYE